MSTRPIAQIIPAEHTYEGEGFGVFRPFPQARLSMLDPFLLLDEMEPQDHAPSAAIGTSDHPHRGFETVTYMIEGEFDHADSQGNHGTIRAGGVQWMTAGAGIVHREQPGEAIKRNGGRTHGFQLWVNLPAAEKMTAPAYQGFEPTDIPSLTHDGVTLRVVAGELSGLRGVADTHSPVVYAHLTIDPGATFTTELPSEDNVGLYVFAGNGTVGPDRPVNEREFVIYEREGGSITITAIERLEVLLLAGRPLNEPVARYGPFVMNTRQQLIDAFEDYQSGRMGAIAAGANMTPNLPTVIPSARRTGEAVSNRRWRVAGNVPGLSGYRSFLSGPLIRVEVMPHGSLRLRWREMGFVGRVTELELDRQDVRVQYARGRYWLRGVRLDTRHHGVIYLWCSWPSTIDRHELVVSLAACGFDVVTDEFDYRWT